MLMLLNGYGPHMVPISVPVEVYSILMPLNGYGPPIAPISVPVEVHSMHTLIVMDVNDRVSGLAVDWQYIFWIGSIFLGLALYFSSFWLVDWYYVFSSPFVFQVLRVNGLAAYLFPSFLFFIKF